LIRDGYIYIENGDRDNLNAVKLGDIRLTFYEVKSGVGGLVMGRLEDSSITRFVATRETAFETHYESLNPRWFNTSELDVAVSILAAEHQMTTWIFRILGAVLIYVAFLLLINPLITILSFIPFFGKLTGGLAALILLPVAIVISALAMVIAALLNNIITFIILVAGLVALAAFGIVKARKKKAGMA
jgi:hypothetical protein